MMKLAKESSSRTVPANAVDMARVMKVEEVNTREGEVLQ
jgi:hypothetical protein